MYSRIDWRDLDTIIHAGHDLEIDGISRESLEIQRAKSALLVSHHLLATAVRDAKKAGWTWQEIADALDANRQAVSRRYQSYDTEHLNDVYYTLQTIGIFHGMTRPTPARKTAKTKTR